MISLFDYSNYRLFLIDWIEANKATTKGLQSKIAAAANISSSLVSLILSGEKQLTMEQAIDICEFAGLTESETDYFLLLVEYGRAGSAKLQKQLLKKIETQQRALKNRVLKSTDLSDEVKAIYYSSWTYSGVRNYLGIPIQHDILSLANHFKLPTKVIADIVEFLILNGLCVQKNGNLTYGAGRTHVSEDSPFVNQHHKNWRILGINKMLKKDENDLFFTGPMSLSVEASNQITTQLRNSIQKAMKTSGPSNSETVRCLNIDWFEY